MGRSDQIFDQAAGTTFFRNVAEGKDFGLKSFSKSAATLLDSAVRYGG